MVKRDEEKFYRIREEFHRSWNSAGIVSNLSVGNCAMKIYTEIVLTNIRLYSLRIVIT